MIQLLAVLRRYSRSSAVLLAVVLGILSGLSNAGLIAVINRSLVGATAPGPLWAWYFGGLCLVVALTRIASSNLLVQLGAHLASEVQIHLSRRILAAPLRRLEELGPHRLLATLFEDVGTLSDTISFLPVTLINLIVVLGCLGYMGWLSPALLGVVLVVMVVGVLTYRMGLRAGFARQRRAREVGDQLFGQLRGLTQGTKELKTGHRRREEFLRILAGYATGFRGLRVSAQRIFNVAASWGNLLFFVVIGVILYLLPATRGFARETRSGFVLVLLYMSGPLQALLNSVQAISQANVALQKIDALGLSLLESAEPTPAFLEEGKPSWQRLELCAVAHTYHGDDESFSLGPLDLVFEPGELVFVVGGNGSGKTTFAKLLIGLYTPEAGEIRWNGQPVRSEDLERYRELFTVVFSDFFLFEKLLGLDLPNLDSKALEFLHKLRLNHKVRIEDGAFSTTDLSQGQRKRLALLAAFLEDRPVYVFDEWAADQDPEFKEVFYRQLLPELRARHKTVFVISHDDRYFDAATRIIKLDYGSVVGDQKSIQKSPQTSTAGSGA